jgi:hypothetical protein
MVDLSVFLDGRRSLDPARAFGARARPRRRDRHARPDHPSAVVIREDTVTPALDAWLAAEFAPRHLETALASGPAQHDETEPANSASLRRRLAEGDRKLARHRAAIEAGVDPTLVTTWIKEVEKERQDVTKQLGHVPTANRGQTMTAAEIAELVDRLGDLLDALHGAEPDDRCSLYHELGLQLRYDHVADTLTATATPPPPVNILAVSEGGLDQYASALRRRHQFAVDH